MKRASIQQPQVQARAKCGRIEHKQPRVNSFGLTAVPVNGIMPLDRSQERLGVAAPTDGVRVVMAVPWWLGEAASLGEKSPRLRADLCLLDLGVPDTLRAPE